MCADNDNDESYSLTVLTVLNVNEQKLIFNVQYLMSNKIFSM